MTRLKSRECDRGMRPKVNKTGRNAVKRIFVRRIASIPASIEVSRGRLHVGTVVYPCSIGRSGISIKRREGDGITPLGSLAVMGGLFRADRFIRVPAKLRLVPIRSRDGWCDEVTHNSYNHKITIPFSARHERLWRDDGLYDVLLILDYNLRPRIKGRGSAIFFHIATPDMTPTEGCVAISRNNMRKVLPNVSRRLIVEIG